MDLRQLLGKLDIIEGSMKQAAKNPTGPKFTGKWKGTDAGTPGRKLVGDSIEPEESILKDLSKGPTPKTREQELAEQFEQFLQALEEENLGVSDKRPLRQGSRPARDYGKTGEHSKRYTYDGEETDESRGHKIIATKLKDLERKPVSDEEYAKHQERMKAAQKEYLKKNPNSIYKKVDEVAPVAPVAPANDPKKAQAVQQATTTLKSAIGSSVPTQNLAKAIDSASQGGALDAKTSTALQPMMQDVATIAQDPKLAGQFKSLLSQVQQKQTQQQKQQAQQKPVA